MLSDIIILAGVDTAGKSTIANLLHANGYQVIYSPYRNDYSSIITHYENLVENCKGKVVFDRSFITEAVYGPVMRGNSRINRRELGYLAKMYANHDASIVYVYEQYNIVQSRLKSSLQATPTHKVTLANLSSLLVQFHTVLSTLDEIIPVHIVRSSDVTMNTIENITIQQLRESSDAILADAFML